VSRIQWDKKLAAKAVACLKKHERADDAAAELGLSTSALRQGVLRTTSKNVSDFLRKAKLAPRPIEEQVREAATVRKTRLANAERDLALKRVDALERLVSQYEACAAEPLRRIEMPSLKKGPRRACAVALLSDIHHEERVRRSRAIDNEHDPAISRARLARFFRGVEWLIKNSARGFEVRDLVLWIGGDTISGHIHDELVETTAMPPGEAMLDVMGILISGIEALLKGCPKLSIKIPMSWGNHPRTTKRVRAATGYGHSWEWVMYQLIAQHFASHPRVQCHTDREEHQYVDVGDFTLAFHHGHRINFNGGIGGVTVPLIKKLFTWGKWVDATYYHIGHFHTFLDLRICMLNGSVIGPSPYAQAIGAAPEDPMQGFYLLDEKRGKTFVSPVWVGDR
jgi:hypothetical protein